MKKRFALALLAAVLLASPTQAQNCSPYTYTLTNGNSADASQVQGNFNSIQNCANSNLAHNGANSDITSLSGLSTPLSAAQGGTATSGTLGGDLSSTFPSPTVVSTHLASPLPIAQGGTGKGYFSMPGGPEYSIIGAATTDLGTATSNAVAISGNAAITSFGSSASTSNPYYFLRFTGASTLTYNATSMQLNSGGNNYITTAGDTAVAQYLGSGNWKLAITPVTGNPVLFGGPQLVYESAIASGTTTFSYDFGTTYKWYEVIIIGLGPQTNAVELNANFRAGGSVIGSAGSYQWIETRYYNGGSGVDGSGADTKFVPGGNTGNWSSSYKASSATIRIFPDTSGNDVTAQYSVNYMNTSSQVSVVNGSTYCAGTGLGRVSGIQFNFTSGTMNAGLFEVFGYP